MMKNHFNDWWHSLGSTGSLGPKDSASVCWHGGYNSAIKDVEERLAAAIIHAENCAMHASMNGGTSSQVAIQATLYSYRAMFAFATETFIDGMGFNLRLNAAKERLSKGKINES